MRYTNAHTMSPALINALHNLGISIPTICITRKKKDQTKELVRVLARNQEIMKSDHSKRFWRGLSEEMDINDGNSFVSLWMEITKHLLVTSGNEVRYQKETGLWNETGKIVAGSFFENGWYNKGRQIVTEQAPNGKLHQVVYPGRNARATHAFHVHLQRCINSKGMRWGKVHITIDGDYRLALHTWPDLEARIL